MRFLFLSFSCVLVFLLHLEYSGASFITRFTPNKSLKCWVCEESSSDAECYRIGKWMQCGPSQSCFVEQRYENGIEIHKRGCKQDSACSALMMQNEFQCNSMAFKNHYETYYRNPVTCRDCCDSNYCNPTATNIESQDKKHHAPAKIPKPNQHHHSNRVPSYNANRATLDYPIKPTSHYHSDKGKIDYPINHQHPDKSSYQTKSTTYHPKKLPSRFQTMATHYPAKPVNKYPSKPAVHYPAKPAPYNPVKPTMYYQPKPTIYKPVKPTSLYPHKPSTHYPAKPKTPYPTKPATIYPEKPTTHYPTKSSAQYTDRPNDPRWYKVPQTKVPSVIAVRPTKSNYVKKTYEPEPTPQYRKLPDNKIISLGQVYYPGIGWISLSQSKEQRPAPAKVVYNQEKTADAFSDEYADSKELMLN